VYADLRRTFVLYVLLCMQTYQGCLYCKYYCVCRLIKDVCIVSITVYVDLPRVFVL
jgi:hypothetical protein